MIIIEKVLLLKNSEIFQNCKEPDLIEIAAICTESSVDKGVTIFEKGAHGNCMYFIYSGTVSIHDGAHQLATLSENEIFGELSLLDSETRSASANRSRDAARTVAPDQPVVVPGTHAWKKDAARLRQVRPDVPSRFVAATHPRVQAPRRADRSRGTAVRPLQHRGSTVQVPGCLLSGQIPAQEPVETVQRQTDRITGRV